MQKETKSSSSLKAYSASKKPVRQHSRTTWRNSDVVSASSHKAQNSQFVKKNIQVNTLKKKKNVDAAGKENHGDNIGLKKKNKEMKSVSFNLKTDSKLHDTVQSTSNKRNTEKLAARKQRATLSSHSKPDQKTCLESASSASMLTSTQIQLPLTDGNNEELSSIPDVSSETNKDIHATKEENTKVHIPYEPRSTFLKNIKLQSGTTDMLMDPGNQRPVITSNKTPDQYPWRRRLQNIPSQNFYHNIPETNSTERALIKSKEGKHVSKSPALPKRPEFTSKVPPLLGYDWIAGLMDNEADDTTKKSKAWFDEIKDFRRQNWFECHANKPTGLTDCNLSQLDSGLYAKQLPPECSKLAEVPETSSRDELQHGQEYYPHKCIHHFRINNRLFTEPVLQDEEGISMCPICLKSKPKYNLDFQNQQNTESPPADIRVTVPTAVLQGSAKSDVKNIIGSKSKAGKQNDSKSLGSSKETVNKIKRQSYEPRSRLWKNRRIQGTWPPLLEEKQVPKTVSYPIENSLALRHQKFNASIY